MKIGKTYLWVCLVFAGFLSGYFSCISDKCGKVICKNGGVCVNGLCACPSGYEGTNCESVWSQKFTGFTGATDIYLRDTATHRYTISVSNEGLTDSFVVSHFASGIAIGSRYLFPDTIKLSCVYRSYNSFLFATNQYIDTATVITSGSGTLDATGTKITGTYYVRLKDTSIIANFTWTK